MQKLFTRNAMKKSMLKFNKTKNNLMKNNR